MGALPLTANYLAATVIGKGGYAYSYNDMTGSAACNDLSAFCGTGMTAVADAAGKTWGAGIGVSLNQAMATSSASPPVGMYAVTGSGLTYTLSNLPTQGARLIIDDGGKDYCTALTSASGTAKWADFNSACWNMSGTGLSGAPQTATHVQFQVTAGPAAGAFDFCVTALSVAP
ncbi:MAG TPA: hypothetical protein VKU41_32235 [Polyangiaceae bacterium]|nr:hypothetical protein [Polyangiaceae bacterium]